MPSKASLVLWLERDVQIRYKLLPRLICKIRWVAWDSPCHRVVPAQVPAQVPCTDLVGSFQIYQRSIRDIHLKEVDRFCSLDLLGTILRMILILRMSVQSHTSPVSRASLLVDTTPSVLQTAEKKGPLLPCCTARTEEVQHSTVVG